MNFKSLKSGLGVALRNTKSSFFANATIDKIKSVQERWENSVDDKERTYANLLNEMERNNIHLPTDEELKADLTLGVDYFKQQLTAEKAKAILELTVRSSKQMSDATIGFIRNRFLDTPETENLVDEYFREEIKTAEKDAEEQIDAVLRGKKPKKKKKSVHKKASQKLGKLVDSKTQDKIKRAKTFKRAGPAARLKLKDQLNAILEYHVIQNMGSPALNHWGLGIGHMGRKGSGGQTFARSAKVDRVAPRTIFFDYNTRPYSVFDPRVSHYHNLSNANRNPRAIISAALGDALYSLKVTTPYTYRQDHSL